MSDEKTAARKIVWPRDVALMQSILNDHFGPDTVSAERRESLAKHLLELFEMGKRDRGSLLSDLAQFEAHR